MLSNFKAFVSKLDKRSMDKRRSNDYHFLMHILKIVLVGLLSLSASAAQFKYNELMIKDYDEMNHMVQAKVKKARAVGSNTSDENINDQEAIEQLREALKLIFSRPNSDNMIAKLTPEVRRELSGYGAFNDVISGLAAEALAVVKSEKAPPSQQATGIFLLENMLSEIRPEIGNNEGLRRVVEKIRDAKVEISSDVKRDLKLRGMFKAMDPSKLASDILKAMPKEDPKKAAKAQSDDY